ncbi:MAG: hypothetical protein FWG36_07325 [Oscillospiraceae bacterium]|nr:hypothetical protein [Oscillospiraceae bacterium]
MTLFKQCLLLFWVQMKMRLGLSAMKYYRKHDKKKFNMNIFILVAIIYGLGATLFVYGAMYRAIVKSVIELGFGSLLLAVTVLLAMILSMFFGLLQLNATVFNSKDVEWYAPMPLKPESVFFAKFGLVYLLELATSAFILLPAYVLYSVEIGSKLGFWLVAVITLPFVPIIPLALSALLSLPLAKFSSRFRNREIISTVLTVVLALGIMAGSMLSSGVMGRVASGESINIDNILYDVEPILRLLTSVFPPATWLAVGLTFADGAVSSLLLFAGVSILLLTFTVWLAGKMYYSGVLAILEAPPAKRRAGKPQKVDAQAKSPLFALVLSDFKLIVRTPIYLMNSFSGIFIGVIVFIMPLALNTEWDNFKGMLDNAINDSNPSLILAIMALITIFSGVINPAASTAFSRDGKTIWLMQTIPVPIKTHIMAKIICSTFTAAISAIIINVCVCVVFPKLIPFAIMAYVPAVLAIAAASAASMIPDIISPKLKWDNEAEAMKQNMNTLWGMLTCLPVTLIMIGLLAVIAFTGTQSLTVSLIALLILTAGLAYGGLYVAVRIAEPRFKTRGERL